MVETNKIILGDCIEELKKLPDNSIDAVITDPPYFFGSIIKRFGSIESAKAQYGKDGSFQRLSKGFMGKNWDGFSDLYEFQVFSKVWAIECLRVLKPGGYLLSFGGTRTYHRMTCGIEDAGFEIRDCIMWIYGCLSEDTEVLTNFGWLKWEHIHKTIKYINDRLFILVYDNQKNIFKWEKPERWQSYNINKDICYRIKSNNTDQLVSRNHSCLVEREGKLIFKKAEELSEMEYMPTLSNDFLGLQKRQTKVLFQKMQWILQGIRMEEMGKNRSIKSKEKKSSIRKEKSIMERWNNLFQKERKLWEIQNKICSMSKRIYNYGKKGWLCDGTQINNGKEVKQISIKNGGNSSYRPQSREQSYREFNSFQDKQGTQNTRGIRIEKAKITKQEYTGLVFCPTVSTGCFVARRKNKIFITGNSGFPKSLNIGKQIDKINGTEYPKNEKVSDNNSMSGVITTRHTIEIQNELAKQWEGWGTALKPAVEPIVVARKPLSEKNVALNVLKWGTGGINIDECRIGTREEITNHSRGIESAKSKGIYGDSSEQETHQTEGQQQGRFPANILLSCFCNKMKLKDNIPFEIKKEIEEYYAKKY